MDGWNDGWMDRWMDGWMDISDIQIELDRQIDGWMDGWMDVWMDGWIEIFDRYIGRWIDRDIEIDTKHVAFPCESLHLGSFWA